MDKLFVCLFVTSSHIKKRIYTPSHWSGNSGSISQQIPRRVCVGMEFLVNIAPESERLGAGEGAYRIARARGIYRTRGVSRKVLKTKGVFGALFAGRTIRCFTDDNSNFDRWVENLRVGGLVWFGANSDINFQEASHDCCFFCLAGW